MKGEIKMKNDFYSRECGSFFPDSLLNMPEFKDIDDSVKDVMMQYYQFLDENNYDSACALLEAHPELGSYTVNAAKLNLMTEELSNIGKYALLLRTNIVSDTEPELSYDEGTNWIKPIAFYEVSEANS